MKNLAKVLLVLVGLTFTHFHTFSQAPTNGLVAYYPFNNFLANDESGNGRNGTFSGGVSAIPDRLGNANSAYNFNGTGSITIPWGQLTGNAARSMSLWFKCIAPSTSQYMLSWGTFANANIASSLGTYVSPTGITYLGFLGNSNDITVIDQLQYFDNRWHLMTFSYDGTLMKLFFDGALVQSYSTGILLNTSNTSLVIGFGSTGTANYFYTGSLDEVRVYNRALTATEVLQMYSAEVAPSTTTDVVRVGINKFAHVTGTDNTYLGIKSGAFSSGASNTFMGVNTGLFNTGSFNSFMGAVSGVANTSGQNNVFMGWASGNVNTSGSDNTLVGAQAGGLNKAGSYNTNIGKLAGYDNVGGSNNTFLGAGANTFGVNKASLFSSSAIGTNARVSINNAIVLGDFENIDLKVGIGLHNPKYRLDVKGVFNVETAFNSPSMKINGKDFLGIDETGEFWVSDFKMRYKTANNWADKVFQSSYKLQPIEDVAKFALKNKHLPNMPSAEEVVEKGVEVQSIISKLLEKVEELTLYLTEQDKINKLQTKEIEKLKELLQNKKN